MAAANSQPLPIVKDPGFIGFVQLLDKKFLLPSRTKMRNTLLPDLFNDVRDSLTEKLIPADSDTITTDLWTSLNTESFLSLSVHFRSNNSEKLSASDHLTVEE